MRIPTLLLLAAVTLTACAEERSPQAEDDVEAETETSADVEAEAETSGVEGEDFVATADDFRCLKDWDQVRRFRIANPLGYLDEALAVANDPEGGVYPVGTIIQLIPLEAMVKRGEGFSEETRDWEFFSLSADSGGTTIQARGTTEVTNFFGGNCFDCHAKAEPQWDMICEQDHGCDPLGIDADFIANAQDSDPRCP